MHGVTEIPTLEHPRRRRRFPWRPIGILVVLLVALWAAWRWMPRTHPDPEANGGDRVESSSGTAPEVVKVPGAFSDLRPRDGGILVPPRIGFRWQFHPEEVVAVGSGSPEPRSEEGEPAPLASSPSESSSSEPSSSEPSSSVSSPSAAPVRFTVVVVDSLGRYRVREETELPEIQVSLPPEAAAGRYRWWIEAELEGGGPRISSDSREFTLRAR